MKKKTIILLLIFSAFILPQLILVADGSRRIYKIEDLPEKEYGIVFGARVYSEHELSPIAKQRADGAVLAYKQGKVQKLFVSGTNSAANETDVISDYIISQGINEKDIIKDNIGIDTADTCRHFSKINNNAILFSQNFHLPRAMHICNSLGVSNIGADITDVTVVGSTNLLQTFYIRTQRYLREVFLTWSYLLGFYNKFSNDAEKAEAHDQALPKSTP